MGEINREILMEAEQRLHQSGLIDAVKEWGQKVQGSEVVINPPIIGGGFRWPGVVVVGPPYYVGDIEYRLRMVFESTQYPDRLPQVALYGCRNQKGPGSLTGSGIVIPRSTFRFSFNADFPNNPSKKALLQRAIPDLLTKVSVDTKLYVDLMKDPHILFDYRSTRMLPN